MKKQFAALFMVVTILLSGIAGFVGTYIANNLAGLSAKIPSAYQGVNSGRDAEQLNEYESAYITDYFVGDVVSADDPNDMSSGVLLLSNSNTVAGALSIPEIASLTSNCVVEIYTETVTSGGRMRQFVAEGAGSGVIIRSDGYIATNNHVISSARKITVRLRSGIEYDAALVGRDSKTDLAVLKINATGLKSAIYGDSSKLVVGELAVAIGNPLGQLGGTVTEGIISALSRSIDIDGEMMALLQTSAAVNPGNSGGGLFNGYGELIGVVNAKSSGSDIEGIGFAIPVNTVKSVAEALIQYGYVPGRIDLGATLIDVNDARSAMMYRLQTTGIYVSQANSDSGLQAGDRIISVDGKEIKSVSDIKSLIDTRKVGDTLNIIVSRRNQNVSVALMLRQAKS